MRPQAAVDWSDWFAGRVSRMHASEIRELLKLLERPDVVSFAGGIPDPALFPMDAIRRAYADILGRSRVGYGVAAVFGQRRIRTVAALDRRLHGPARRTVRTRERRHHVGLATGLDFIAKLFIHPRDTVLVEEPTYLGALQGLQRLPSRTYDVLFRKQAADYRRKAAENGGRVAFEYVVSDFANPSGETLSLAKRRELLDLAADLHVPVLEDAAYEAIRYDGEPVPAIAALAIERSGSIERSPVIYCGTFSKTVCPGLRVGWICAARDFVGKIVLAKQGGDLHSATINQMVVHRIASTIFDDHVRTLVPPYRRRRDAMLNALAASMPAGVTWSKPEGGMFVWVTLPAGVDGAELLERSPARRTHRVRAGRRVLTERRRAQHDPAELLARTGRRDR